jgi:N-methylhydantoinase A
MEAEAAELMREAGIDPGKVVLQRSVDARYEGQGHEVEFALGALPIDDDLPSSLAPLFDAAHESRFGHRMPSGRESVTFRLRAFGTLHKLDLPVIESGTGAGIARTRRMFIDHQWHECPVFEREALGSGDEIGGPAVIEEPSHITVVGPADTLRVDEFGCLHIAIG